VSNESSTPSTIEAINGLMARIEALERQPTAWTRGDIKLWYRSASDLPTGWHPCDGTVAPDGVTTPDFRGRFPVGLKSSDTAFDTLGETGGAASVNLQHVHLGPDHTHDFDHSHTVSMGGPLGVDGSPGGTTEVPSTPNEVDVADDVHEHVATADLTAGDTGGAEYGANTTSTALSATQSILPPYAVVTFAYRYV
jgi:microcystin-dependent protein